MCAISIERGKILLPIARSSICRALGRAYDANEDAPWLLEQGACFVTLTQNQQLRGCIGTLEAHRSLLDDVKANAHAAAFHDRRFLPLTLAELDYTEIEVSLLSAMQAMQCSGEPDALAQLQPGIDGVVLEFGHYRSTFLPQVWEQLPNAAEFMSHLKLKAGLPSDFWEEGLKLSRYTVTKWKEKDLQPDSDFVDY
jgi:AmmeMemoRadiSam system protein A